LACFIRV